MMTLKIHDVTYRHPDKELLFNHLSISVNRREKAALIGNNGTGKSILLQLIAGILEPSTGTIATSSKPYYVPQLTDRFNHFTVAQALNADLKLRALEEILDGTATEDNLAALDNDWTIADRCREALNYWQLPDVTLDQRLGTLSGGEKTKVFLAGTQVLEPEFILFDEPSNHLDVSGRSLLYDFIRSATQTLIVVSHDKALLNLTDTVLELSANGITRYGGNYEFYAEQKAIDQQALMNDLQSKEKALRKAKETEREAIVRQEKLNARGKKNRKKPACPK